MNASGNNKPATTATSTASAPPAPQSEADLLAQEAAAARAAIAAVWRQLVTEVKGYPQEVVDQHPWGAMLASASTGAVLGAGTAKCVRDRAECEADGHRPRRHPHRRRQPRQPAQAAHAGRRHDPRGKSDGALKDMAKAASADVASTLLTSTLLQAAPAFIMGFMGAGAPQQGPENSR